MFLRFSKKFTLIIAPGLVIFDQKLNFQILTSMVYIFTFGHSGWLVSAKEDSQDGIEKSE